MSTKINIIVNLQIEAFHNWPAAKEVFPEVGFLAERHRHIFHICCKKEVDHDDRDVEIILFKRTVLEYLYDEYVRKGSVIQVCELGSTSCEMLARELLERFKLEYCSVLEDNENGAEIYKVRSYTTSGMGSIE